MILAIEMLTATISSMPIMAAENILERSEMFESYIGLGWINVLQYWLLHTLNNNDN